MEFIKNYIYIILCLIYNLIFLYVSYKDSGYLRITLLHILFGLVPLAVLIIKMVMVNSKRL